MNAIVARMAARFVATVSLAMMAILIPPAHAQTEPSSINAIVTVAPPFVMQKGGELTGFSVELWNAIAGKLKVRTNYLIARDVTEVYDTMRSKKADVTVLPVYYTTQRDSEFDFSYSIINAGFLVMVPYMGGSAVPDPFIDLVHLIFSPGLLLWLGVGLILLLIPAHIFWLLDRGNEDSISPGKGYIPGIFQAMIFAATALVSQVQQLPGHRLPRVLALVWMFVGVVFIAFYTAQLTADLTVQQIRGLINGPADLPGKAVGTLAGTLAVRYLEAIGADVREYPTVDEMFAALREQKVDAVVQVAPALRYYAAHEGAGKVTTVGDEFRKEDLGFIVQLNSPLRRRINGALIALHEDGTYEELYTKWFGGP